MQEKISIGPLDLEQAFPLVMCLPKVSGKSGKLMTATRSSAKLRGESFTRTRTVIGHHCAVQDHRKQSSF